MRNIQETSIGIDYGGSFLRIAAAARNKILWKKKIAAPRPSILSATIKKILRKMNCPHPTCLRIAARGMWKLSARKQMQRHLSSLATTVEVFSDAQAAYRMQLKEKAGVLILAGTGSVVVAYTRQRRWIKLGGRAPLHGDPGSAQWLVEHCIPTNKFSSSTPSIALLAQQLLIQKNETTNFWMQRGAEMLAKKAKTMIEKIGLSRSPQIAFWGGLALHPEFLPHLKKAVRKQIPSATIRLPQHTIEEFLTQT